MLSDLLHRTIYTTAVVVMFTSIWAYAHAKSMRELADRGYMPAADPALAEKMLLSYPTEPVSATEAPELHASVVR